MINIIKKGTYRKVFAMLAVLALIFTTFPATPRAIAETSSEEKPFTILPSGVLEKTAGIRAKATVVPKDGVEHAGDEATLFQLMKGTTPISIVALEKDITTQEEFIAHFNVADYEDPDYMVRTFVFDRFDSDTTAPVNLATPVDITSESERVATPIISKSGAWGDMTFYTIQCDTPGANIYYTTDGSTPTIFSQKYDPTGWGIVVSGATRIKAIAVKDGMRDSEVVEFRHIAKVGIPIANPSAGTYKTGPTVELTSSSIEAKIYYTTDGSTPTKESTLYTEPIVVTGKITIKAIATMDGFPDSDVATFEYDIDPNMPTLTDEASISSLIEYMSLEEKAFLLGGNSAPRLAGSAGGTNPLMRYNIPTTSLPDGPAGVRITALPGGTAPDGTPLTRYATQFPNASSRAATWNTELTKELGEAMGKELYYFGADLLLAPGMNTHRHPLNGRNFEYYSEDPLLSGKIAAAEVNGIQSEGAGATIKHFAANNQETGRSNLPTNISQRALREIYLKGFEIAVKDAQPWAIMTSYNQINGVSTSQNPELLQKIAREEWGFEGIFMTDWGGQGNASYWEDSPNAHSSMVKAGLDLSMPSGNANNIIAGYNAGFISMGEIDACVRRFLEYILKTPTFNGSEISTDHNIYAEENEEIAFNAAVEGMIILENKTVNGKSALPLTGDNVVTIGNATNNMVRGGAGSGNVNIDTSRLVHLAEALEQQGKTVIDATKMDFPQIDSVLAVGGMGGDPAFKEMSPTGEQLAQLVNQGDSVIMTIRRGSAEGVDIKAEKGAYYISDAERFLIETASNLCREEDKPFIVVLSMGSPIEMESWKDKADAILLAWEPGTVLAKPVAAVLTGAENPSGKLPTTFQIDVKGNHENGMPYVAAEEFGISQGVTYTEGIYVGYRYYDTFDVPVSYEFGFGKNYSTFEYSDLTLNTDTFDGSITVSLNVYNTSEVPGKEIVQLYVGAPGMAMPKPVKELKAFAKTRELENGEKQTLTFELDAMSLASFDEERSVWVVEPGVYTVYAAASSKDIRGTATFTVGEEITVETVNNVLIPKVEINEIRPDKGLTTTIYNIIEEEVIEDEIIEDEVIEENSEVVPEEEPDIQNLVNDDISEPESSTE